jgi:hypothetical protein
MTGRLSEVQRINERLGALHKRLQQISDLEAEAAPYGGLAARGHFEPERDRIIAETDALLDRWEAILNA